MSYTPTIGLEIHAELKTRTKMFCACKNDPDETRPNINICPVCMAHPGALPVVNREAVKHVLKMGVALNGTLADYTEFDRKNYFYPDLPKGYQISQYQYPLVSGGTLNGVQITRIHLEEDTARSQHGGTGTSLVDFNRGGLPLMELVTEPVIHDAKTASAFAQELQLLLRYLEAGEANMEKGQMRVEANVSVSNNGTLGTKVEVKNLNSFKSVERAIAYEIERQSKLLDEGGKVVQETRGWDENTETTFSQRLKEESHDYRYFPDPDIPKFRLSQVSEFGREVLEKELPELPWQKRNRILAQGLDAQSAEVIVADSLYSGFYRAAIEPIKNPEERKVATNIFLTTVRGINPTATELSNLGTALADVAAMRVAGTVSSTMGTMVITDVLKTGRSVAEIIKEKGGAQIVDLSAIAGIVAEVIAANGKVVGDVKSGKIEAMKFLIGQGMKLSKGSASPVLLEEELKKQIGV